MEKNIEDFDNLWANACLDFNSPEYEQIKSFLRTSHLKYLQGKKNELEGEMWKYHHFSPGWAKENGISVRLENKLNDLILKVYNLAKQEEIDEINREIEEI